LSYLLLPVILTVGLRESGASRQWDLLALDRLLRMRPPEAIDDRIVIVTIDESDLKQEQNKSSISDRNLVKAINLIASAKPSVIGVDIIRDGQIDPLLIETYQRHQNVVGLAKVLPPDRLAAPRGLATSRIGFGDYEPDADGSVRRAILAIFDRDRLPRQEPKYSFAFQISRLYLEQKNQKIRINSKYLDLGSQSIFPIKNTNSSDSADYFDIVINYRSTYPTFPQVKLADVLAQKSLNLKDKIVLIGYTATTKQDFVNTNVIVNPDINGSIYGVEYHGQIISQLISTALDGRTFIQILPLWSDYLWIFACVITTWLIFRAIELNISSQQLLLTITCYFTAVFTSIYLLFLIGWWLSFGFTFVTILLVYLPISISFYQRERSLVAIARKRHQVISETFSAIHNGPLQELSLLLQSVRSENISLSDIDRKLGQLDQQIRQIGDALRSDVSTENKEPEILVLGNGYQIDLNIPLNEIFYLVADRTVGRDRYPNLTNLKIKIIDFQEIPNETKLGINLKRQLCQFLEEAIGNVGKYAEGATRLQLIGRVDGDLYRLTIEDNGRGEISSREGEGTNQARCLATSLRGKFVRSQKPAAHGVICSIEWNFSHRF
jgi:CHASE2 domain-containing sensor protein